MMALSVEKLKKGKGGMKETQGASPKPLHRCAAIAILIPAYQCEATIGEVVSGAAVHGLPVIVVDDGSTDRTAEIAAEQGAEVVRHGRNRGKGEALKTGFGHAEAKGFDAVITLDGDAQHDPREIPKFIAAHERYPEDIILGSRMGTPEKMRRLNRFSNRMGIFFLSLLTGQPVADSQTGYRLHPMTLMRRMTLTSSHFDLENEILIKASRLGVRLRAVPISTIYHEVHTTHYRTFVDTVRIVKTVLRILLWRPPQGEMEEEGSHLK